MLPRPTVAIANYLGHALDKAKRLFIRAAQEQRTMVCGNCEADLQVRLAAAGLSAKEQLVRIGEKRIGLRPGVGHPPHPRDELVGLRQRLAAGASVQTVEGGQDVGDAEGGGHGLDSSTVRRAGHGNVDVVHVQGDRLRAVEV